MTRIWIGALAGLTLVAACMETTMPDHSDGHALYAQYCASCHGDSGTGDGPYARNMAKPPKNLTLIQVRHGNTFPRAKVMSIVDGYTRLDDDRPGMPEFGTLLEGELVPFDSGDGVQTPTPWKLVALVEYLESIQKTR
ncbi:c-type cytochrome [Mesobacterium sp. TK19101]|uniref:C-type cytochrome n=1 Tax=Mesobacterium hydrothermale TaxID=3111907 RepID=A0ABU6HG74_9RHOB|nr:c-type cytochrome [Mesobacterium sp. TK19101]MEC3861132.1 c-type cytochrome [Mesobacterium sp. TK19101]